MSTEIERKFLLVNDAWRGLAPGVPYRQGYLTTGVTATVRIRTAADDAFVTIKGATRGISRAEYEYRIPTSDAKEMLESLCIKPLISKIRYAICTEDGSVWEVDEFLEENEGLIVAEIELHDPEQTFTKPAWIGKEVTHDPRFRNSSLVNNPFSRWSDKEKAAITCQRE